MHWCLILGVFFSSLSAQGSPLRGGEQVPLANIFEITSVAAAADDSKGWCTPAMQVGPRVFITAAHCLAVFNRDQFLKIEGRGINKRTKFSYLSLGEGLKDELVFSSPECKHLISNIPDESELTLEQMKRCWANDGQADLALLISEESVPGRYLSISQKANSVGEKLMLLGYTPDCGGNPRFYRATWFAIYGFNNLQVIFDGSGMGITDHDSSACNGDSGGAYLRISSNGSVELNAIHSGGTKEENTEVSIHGKKLRVPRYFAGGTDLTSVPVQKWLLSIANQKGIEICGINISCPKGSIRDPRGF